MSTIAQYQRDGHILIRSLATKDEIEPYRAAIRQLTEEAARNLAPLNERGTYGKAFIQHTNLWERDEICQRFVLAKRFARVAAALMGVDSVRLYHDQALFKEPQGGLTPWHQDQQYWPLDDVKCITMWMPLVDVSAEMGTMRFASGSHKLGYLGPLDISDDSEERLQQLISEKGYSITESPDMNAGDATFHDGWCLHGAPGNASADRMREVMTVIYFEDGARISQPDSESRQKDLEAWFPGLEAGDLAASRINPRLI
ncbi:phytanoyl-CoA dioxygenase family protein [Kamptonema cortianum]|nr:phytanoyl-CoA dioxygenase family protein [Geitlerinema splendidum]MDK3157709.1 phytanoyl-CoA dioxygenase family protein [Kamptonema cortianum]